MSDIIDTLRDTAVRATPRVLLAEHRDRRVLTAGTKIAKAGIATPVVIDSPEAFSSRHESGNIDKGEFEVVEPGEDFSIERQVAEYVTVREVPERTARRMLESTLVQAMILLRQGDIDGVVAGARHPTADVVATANSLVGLAPGIDTASSFFLMLTENPDVGNDGNLLYADCGINIEPTANQLADIAQTTAQTAKQLLNWDPRIAMLSFSTVGSAEHQSLTKIRNAVSRVRSRTDLDIEGEVQADTALVPEIAERKLGPGRTLNGDANTLIFPDLESGNIAYKLTEHLANATAIGPVLQGYARPINDLSRGADVDNIYHGILLTAARAANWESDDPGKTIHSRVMEQREDQGQILHPPEHEPTTPD